jgi:hypothetical protein
MSMDQAAFWLAGSILLMLGVIILVIGILIVNNLFSKYWKPVTLTKYNYHPVYFDPTYGDEITTESNTKKEAKQ